MFKQQLGTSEVCKRLDAMIRDAKKNASISEKTKFASLVSTKTTHLNLMW